MVGEASCCGDVWVLFSRDWETEADGDKYRAILEENPLQSAEESAFQKDSSSAEARLERLETGEPEWGSVEAQTSVLNLIENLLQDCSANVSIQSESLNAANRKLINTDPFQLWLQLYMIVDLEERGGWLYACVWVSE